MPVMILIALLLAMPTALAAQGVPVRPFMADSSPEAVIRQFRSTDKHAEWLTRILRQDGTTQPPGKLDEIAHRLSEIAIEVKKDESDLTRTTIAGRAVGVIAIVGGKHGRGMPHPRALELLINIHRNASNRGVRSLAVANMLRVTDHGRGVAYLKAVAATTDETAERAITALIMDVYGDVNGSAAAEKAASNAALRDLFERNAVKAADARRSLNGWAQSQGWPRP